MITDLAGKADTIVLGGRVISVHPGVGDDYHGLALKDGRIMRLIRREQMAEMCDDQTRVHDLGDRPLLPGFIDVHAHSEVVFRTAFATTDCRAPECADISDVSDALSKSARETDAGDWVVGQGNLFFDRKLKEGRLPNRDELDRVSRDHPIALRAGGHITVLNTAALEAAGIDRDYVEPTYSVTGPPQVERDANGDPTGIVKEMDALLPLPGVEKSRLRDAFSEGIERYFTRNGVTTIGEISETIDGIQTLDDMAQADELPLAYRIYLWAPGTMKLEEACNWQEHFSLGGSQHDIRIQGLKLFADGGFSARSAAVSCPYLGTDGVCGEIAFAKYFFRRAVEMTLNNNMQLSVHANGNRAQEWLCERLLELGGASSGKTRMRIEHAANLLPRPETMDLWARAGVIPVPQAVFLYTFGEYFEDYLGDFGRQGRFPFKSLMAQGWRLNASSDVWIGSEREATNPLFSIWCCLKRQAYSGALLEPEEALTLDQALRMHTIDSAAAIGEDDVRGSLAPGKIADVIALERDPYHVKVDDLRTLAVDFVMAQGKVVRDVTKAAGGGTA
jgi:predicted amidohydrolase YtcJ